MNSIIKHSTKCLLCGANEASKKNSHILPKFISSDFLGDKQSKKGYMLDSRREGKTVIQDSPKQDYILCPDCEAYFSILEATVAQEIKRLHEESEGELICEVLECLSLPPTVFHLFYLSQFWRSSIASIAGFESFKFTPGIEDYMNRELNKFNSVTRADFQAKLASNDLERQLVPYAIFTSLEFSDKTKNIIHARSSNGQHCLIADKFAFILYENKENIPVEMQQFYNKDSRQYGKVTILHPLLWEDMFIRPSFSLLANTNLESNNKH